MFLFSPIVYGQQWNQLSMNNFHPYYSNASYAGFDRAINLTLFTRNQWVGLDGSPKTRYIGAHLPIYILKAGFGTEIFTSSEGNIEYRSLRLSGNKIFNIFGGTLSAGARLGFHYLAIDGKSIRTPEGDYDNGSVLHNDNILLTDRFNGLGLGWEGSFWFRKNNYQCGISFAELPSNTFDVKLAKFSRKENINLFFQLYFDISESIQLQPYISFKTDLNYLQTEISAVSRINGNIFGGIMFRGYSSSSIDALGIQLGHKINKRYSIYYNYDVGLSSLKRVNEGSHEIILRINFYNLPGTGIPPKIIFNPRFLE
jgi:type IX secretion system PorP/SprF family membrane protein